MRSGYRTSLKATISTSGSDLAFADTNYRATNYTQGNIYVQGALDTDVMPTVKTWTDLGNRVTLVAV